MIDWVGILQLLPPLASAPIWCLLSCLKCRNPSLATIPLAAFFINSPNLWRGTWRRSEICSARRRSWVADPENCASGGGGEVFAAPTDHKVSFPNFPSTSASAATLVTLLENVPLFYGTNRVWKIDIWSFHFCHWSSNLWLLNVSKKCPKFPK